MKYQVILKLDKKNERRWIHDLSAELGYRIRMLRMARRLTQSELADKLRVSHHMVSKWELGQREISVSDLQYLCEILHSSMAYFFGDGNLPVWSDEVLNVVKDNPGLDDIGLSKLVLKRIRDRYFRGNGKLDNYLLEMIDTAVTELCKQGFLEDCKGYVSTEIGNLYLEVNSLESRCK